MRLDTKVTIAITLVVAATIFGFGPWRYRQDHLSPGVKNAFCSAVSQTASVSDTAFFLRSMKLAADTRQDRYVTSALDRAFSALEDYNQAEQEEESDLIESSQLAGRTTDCRQLGTRSEVEQRFGEVKSEIGQYQKGSSERQARMNRDQAIAAKLVAEVKQQQARLCPAPK